MDENALTIDIVSDVVCPWCYVGAGQLRQALAEVPEIAVALRWRPFQLDPSIPDGGVDRKAYMAKKFPPAQLAAAHDRLVELGQAAGIAFDFDAIAVSPNTLDAHRVIRWASGAGVQDAVALALFKAYFEDGRDIGDAEVLAGVAGAAGMDGALVATLLATDADRSAVGEEIAMAQRMGITGVPCFILDGRYAVMGAQPVPALVDALRKVDAARLAGEA